MRITDKMRYSSTRGDMNRLQMRSNKIYKELSSGKRINRPSDDPFGTLQATGLTTHKRLLDQYSRNIDTARINLFAADNALNQAVSIMTEARTTTISAISVLGDGKSHKVMADSISQLKEQLFNLSNSRVGETYIFGGTQSTRKPYTIDEITGKISYVGNTDSMSFLNSNNIFITGATKCIQAGSVIGSQNNFKSIFGLVQDGIPAGTF